MEIERLSLEHGISKEFKHAYMSENVCILYFIHTQTEFEQIGNATFLFYMTDLSSTEVGNITD